jgi:hypothetical protein
MSILNVQVIFVGAPGDLDREGSCVSTVRDMETAETDSNGYNSGPTFRTMRV